MGISIIMPTYNRLAYLQEAIASVQSQTYTDWELLISDDGSNDGTREYLSSLEDPRIRVFLQIGHLGQFGQFNFLFNQARFEVAQILCDDDKFVDENSLATISGIWKVTNPQTGFVRVNHSSDSNSALARFEKHVLPDVVPAEKSDLFLGVFGGIPGSVSNISVRVDCVKEVGMFRPDMNYAGDFDLWSRVGRKYPWIISQAQVVFVRKHEGQVAYTANMNGLYMWQLRTILEPIFSNLVKQGHSATKLRLLFAMNYVAQHRYVGLKALLRRNPRYLQAVSRELDRANFSLGSAGAWLIFFASAAGKVGRISLAKQILAEKTAV